MGGAGYIVTLVNDLPGCWPLDADERFEKRALAGAVRADNTIISPSAIEQINR
jgi:hypothetical protein